MMSNLMTDVYWTLGSRTYESYEDFVAAVTEYNQAISPGAHGWDPDQVVSPGPINVVYEALWKDEDDTLNLDIGSPGSSLTMGELLFALNNASFDFFSEADDCFFEGLALIGDRTYELLIGS